MANPKKNNNTAPATTTPVPVTVTITTSGASVTITAPEPVAHVLEVAQKAHQEAHARCVAAPAGMAGGVGGHL